MTSFKVPQGTIDAARTLLAEANKDRYVTQAYEVVLREADNNAAPEDCRKVYLIPLGPVIGVAVVRGDARPQDADIAFISAAALGTALPALGFTLAARPVEMGYIVPPQERQP